MYLLLSAVFLAAAVVASLVMWHAADESTRSRSVVATGIAGGALLILTIVFDNIMIAAGLFTYDAARISGIRIGSMPVEDLAYPLAATIILPALWSCLCPREEPTTL
ncbi:lycopene cyclase domain-containing protein [Microbacterium sp.]|uniref:lycopene cyclase domain-containing protein n=1 Tax=Microbacterium sp. TaxID=51671 RepID=UPI003C70A823